MTPKLRFPEFTDKWQAKKLGDVIDNIGGTALEIFASTSGSHRFISIGNYSTDGKYVDNGQRISLNPKTSSKLLNRDDLVMVLNDKTTTGDIIGSSILIDENNLYVYNQRSERLVPRKGTNSRFLWMYLNNPRFRKMIFKVSQGGTQIYVNFPAVKILKVSVPSDSEQEKIAEFMGGVDNKLTSIQAKVASMHKYKEGVMQALLSGKLRFKDEIGDPYPDWEEKKLGGLVKFYRGNLLSKADIISDGRYKCVHYGELFTEYNEVIRDIKSSTNVDTKSMSKVGDILMPTSDVTPQGLAKASVISEAGVMLGGDINILRPNSNISPVFLSYMINLQKKKIMRLVSGSTVRHIYSKDIAKIVYRIPAAFEEQQKIADFLVALDDKIKLEEAKLAKSKDFKKALLQRMFI